MLVYNCVYIYIYLYSSYISMHIDTIYLEVHLDWNVFLSLSISSPPICWQLTIIIHHYDASKGIFRESISIFRL